MFRNAEPSFSVRIERNGTKDWAFEIWPIDVEKTNRSVPGIDECYEGNERQYSQVSNADPQIYEEKMRA